MTFPLNFKEIVQGWPVSAVSLRLGKVNYVPFNSRKLELGVTHLRLTNTREFCLVREGKATHYPSNIQESILTEYEVREGEGIWTVHKENVK